VVASPHAFAVAALTAAENLMPLLLLPLLMW
jgi:hypothetical protein